METMNLMISNMRSAHCQSTVTDIVKAMGGNVKPITTAKAETSCGTV